MRIKDNMIEKDLISNSTTLQEYHEAKHLFRTLKCVRMQGNRESQLRVTSGESTYKNYATRLLLASACAPITFFPDDIITQNAAVPNFNPVSAKDRFLPPADPASSVKSAGETFLLGQAVYDYPRSVLITGKKHARRLARSTDRGESLYMPPAASSLEGINRMLRKIYRETEHYFGHPDPLIHSLAFHIKYEQNYEIYAARYILRYSGLFGAKWPEKLTERHKKKILTAWVSSYVFENTWERFLVNEFINISKYTVFEKKVTSRNFESFLTHCIRKKLMYSTDFEYLYYYETSINFIKDNFLLPIMPTFFYNDINDIMMAYPIGSIEWGYLHAGLSFAMSAELDLTLSSEKDVISLGIILESMLREGLTSLSLAKLFMMPAMFYHIKESLDKDRDVQLNEIIGPNGIKEGILEKFFSACDIFNAINEPIIRLAEALKAYQSRKTIETELTNLRCNMEIRPGTPYFQNYQYLSSSKNCVNTTGREENYARQYPTADTIVAKQNADIANAYLVVNKAIILDALHGINADEVGFMTQAKMVIFKVHFKPKSNLKNTKNGNKTEYCHLKIKENIDIFAAEKNNSRRIYALIKETGEYRIKRVDEQITAYFELLDNYSRQLTTDNNITLELYKDALKILKERHEPLDVLAKSLSQIHRDKLLGHLNILNINNTVNKRAEVIFQSLIPFYTCKERLRPRRKNTAIPACSLNIVALARVTGAELDISALAAAEGSNVTGGTGSNVVNGFVARQALKMAIKKDLHSLTAFTHLPASEAFNAMVISKLATEFVHLFDSGLGIIGQISSTILKEVAASVDIVQRYSPALKNLLSRLREKEIEHYLNPTDSFYKMARLPALELEVPVVKLGGDKFRGKEIYARINPEDNDIFSRKYTMTANKTLIPVPMPKGRGLINTRPASHDWPDAAVDARQWVSKHTRSFYPYHQSQLTIEYTPTGKNGFVSYLNTSNGASQIIFSDNIRSDDWLNPFFTYRFDINTFGDRGSEKILFPEVGITLRHESIDLNEFVTSYHRLAKKQKETLQEWILNEEDIRGYKDTLRYNEPLFSKSNSTEMNRKLKLGETLTHAQQEIYDSLMELTQADIPRHRGSYLLSMEYMHSDMQWGDDPRVGDIVTNYPQFMIVSANNKAARDLAKQANHYKKINGVHLQQLITYRIDNAIQGTPLLPQIIRQSAPPVNYLYPPKSYFIIKGISIAKASPPSISPTERVGIILEEASEIPYSARNLFSGKVYIHDSPNPV